MDTRFTSHPDPLYDLPVSSPPPPPVPVRFVPVSAATTMIMLRTTCSWSCWPAWRYSSWRTCSAPRSTPSWAGPPVYHLRPTRTRPACAVRDAVNGAASPPYHVATWMGVSTGHWTGCQQIDRTRPRCRPGSSSRTTAGGSRPCHCCCACRACLPASTLTASALFQRAPLLDRATRPRSGPQLIPSRSPFGSAPLPTHIRHRSSVNASHGLRRPAWSTLPGRTSSRPSMPRWSNTTPRPKAPRRALTAADGGARWWR